MALMSGVKCPKCGEKMLYADSDLHFAAQEQALSTSGVRGIDASAFMAGIGSSTYCICAKCGCGAKVTLTEYGGIASEVPESLLEKAKQRKAAAAAAAPADEKTAESDNGVLIRALWWIGIPAIVGLVAGLVLGGRHRFVLGFLAMVMFASFAGFCFSLNESKKK